MNNDKTEPTMTYVEKFKRDCPNLYYALLEWKDKNQERFYEFSHCRSVHEMNIDQLMSVWLNIVHYEIGKLKEQQTL